jgi:hypothetical protein
MDTAPTDKLRRAFVVLGMHRSGSSAMTRVISLLGAQLPAKLMPAYTHNTPGHWEPQEVADLNDVFLAELGSRWDDPFGPSWTTSQIEALPAMVARARAVLADNYQGSGDIVLKEPRIAVLHDVWVKALGEEGFDPRYIIMVRRPQEVAASLNKRDGMPIDAGLLLWTNYMLASERATRGQARVFVGFDQLLANPEWEIARIETALQINFPARSQATVAAIKKFLDPQHRHEIQKNSAFPEGLEPIGRLISYADAKALDRPFSPGDLAAAEKWFTALNKTSAALIRRAAFAALDHSKGHSANSTQDITLKLQFETVQKELAARVAQAEAQAVRIAFLEQNYDARVEQAEAQHAALARLQAELADRIHSAEILSALSQTQAQSLQAKDQQLELVSQELSRAQVEAQKRFTAFQAELAELRSRLQAVLQGLETETQARMVSDAASAQLRAALSASDAYLQSERDALKNALNREAFLKKRIGEEALARKATEAKLEAARIADLRRADAIVGLEAALAEVQAAKDAAQIQIKVAASREETLSSDLRKTQSRVTDLTKELASSVAESADLQVRLGNSTVAVEALRKESEILAAKLFEAEHRSSGWLMQELYRRGTRALAPVRRSSTRDARRNPPA